MQFQIIQRIIFIKNIHYSYQKCFNISRLYNEKQDYNIKYNTETLYQIFLRLTKEENFN